MIPRIQFSQRQVRSRLPFLLRLIMAVMMPHVLTAASSNSLTLPPISTNTGFVEMIGVEPDAMFGRTVAGLGDLNGDGFADLAVSARRANHGRGEVFLFYGSAQGPKPGIPWLHGNDHCHDFGGVLTGMGDVNRDGFTDTLVSFTRLEGNGASGSRHWSLFLGGKDGLPNVPAWSTTNLSLPFSFGTSTTLKGVSAGDVNGDGFVDLALNATVRGARTNGNECVLVFDGSTNGFSLRPDWIAHSEQTNSCFGDFFTSPGDVNGDGFADLAVAAHLFSHAGKFLSGKVYVYYGSRNGLHRTPAWIAIYDLPTRDDVDEAGKQHFGWALSGGDINGDGLGDLIVGAAYADHSDINEGVVFAYYGNRAGLGSKPDWWLESNCAHAAFGFAGAVVGDANGDGIHDLVLAAPDLSDGQMNEGAVALFMGSKNGLPQQPAWSHMSDLTRSHLGHSVSRVGDVNGDGMDDILVGSEGYWVGRRNVGRALLFYGSKAGLAANHGWRMEKPVLLQANQQWQIFRLRAGDWVYLMGALAVGAAGILLHSIRNSALRRHERMTLLAVKAERDRLARDLHDDLGSKLTSITALTEIVRRELRQNKQGEKNARRISEVAREVSETIEEVIWSAKSSNDTLENFILYLMQYCEPFLAPAGIEVEIDAPSSIPDQSLCAKARQNLFRCVKEALNNVIKHSQATKVNIGITIENERMILNIEDNGRGLAERSNESPAQGNDGLSNMRNRMHEIGGSFEMFNRPDGGVRVSLLTFL